MAGEISSVRKHILIAQTLILLLTIGAGFALFSGISLRNAVKERADGLDRMAQFLAMQIARGTDTVEKTVGTGKRDEEHAGRLSSRYGVPEDEKWLQEEESPGKHIDTEKVTNDIFKPVMRVYGYLPYVINEDDGSFVVERGENPSVDSSEWVRYSSKVIYEMRKQREGWIFYPDNGKTGFNKAHNVIRYVYLKDLGMILAVEASAGSGLNLLSEVLMSGVIVYFLIILIAAMFITLLATEFILIRFGRKLSGRSGKYHVDRFNKQIVSTGDDWGESFVTKLFTGKELDKEEESVKERWSGNFAGTLDGERENILSSGVAPGEDGKGKSKETGRKDGAQEDKKEDKKA